MTVYELNQDQLLELKNDYFYNHLDEYNMCGEYYYYFDIPDSIIFEHYSGIHFVNDDFSCTAGIDTQYDTIDDIKKCLNCEKEKCTNCLRYKNGV